MRRSVLFTRVFSVVIFTITITAVFTTAVYTYVSQSVFKQIKEDELLPRARMLGDVLVLYNQRIGDRLSLTTINEAIGINEALGPNEEGELLMGAFALAVDTGGNMLVHSSGMNTETQQLMLDVASDVLLHGEELRTNQLRALRGRSLVCVGTPIEQGGQVSGAVVLLVPLYEALAGMTSLNKALLLSLLLSMPLVSMMVYFVVGRIVTPLKQMRDVAVGMACGNFEALADDRQRGEVGQLGRSLNYLSRELSRTISALTLERNRLQQAVDGLREGIIATDKEGNVTHYNPAVVNMFAPLRREQEADERMRLIPDGSVWVDFMSVIQCGEPITRVIEVLDGRVQLSISPLMNDEAQIAGAVALFTDVTESERLERTRRDYVANVSHEMRTPLTAMRALLEPLNEGMVNDDETRRRYYSIMLRETMRLSRLINDLMELSRLQSGTHAISAEPLALGPIVADLSGKYDAVAEDHSLSFDLKVPDDCPMVMSNADRLEQVLIILLDNAMKYTPEGGSVALEATWDKFAVTLCVRDSGIGIDPGDQPYVFDRFYKVDKAHSGLGSGLGLSIAQELLSQMGERIWLKSAPGEGTSFFFTITRA